MIARHITSHDENGMRLLGIGREIHRTPTQQALENLAMDLASREGSGTGRPAALHGRCGDKQGVSLRRARDRGQRIFFHN